MFSKKISQWNKIQVRYFTALICLRLRVAKNGICREAKTSSRTVAFWPSSKQQKKMQYTHFMWGPSHQVYTYSVCPPYTRNSGIFNRAWQICKQRRLTMPTISAFGRRVPRWMESSIPFARWCDIHDLLRQTATSRTHLLAPFWPSGQIRAFLATGVVAHTHTRKKNVSYAKTESVADFPVRATLRVLQVGRECERDVEFVEAKWLIIIIAGV